jgi:uncharacterized protein YraI
MKLPNIAKAAGLGAVVLALSASAAFAAVAMTSVNVRSGPSTSFRAVDTLFPGESVAITNRNGGWCAVEKAGPDGWVACRYLAGWGGFRTFDVPGVNVRFRTPRVPMWWGFNPGGINISIN